MILCELFNSPAPRATVLVLSVTCELLLCLLALVSVSFGVEMTAWLFFAVECEAVISCHRFLGLWYSVLSDNPILELWCCCGTMLSPLRTDLLSFSEKSWLCVCTWAYLLCTLVEHSSILSYLMAVQAMNCFPCFSLILLTLATFMEVWAYNFEAFC